MWPSAIQGARALIVTSVEEFGIAAVESQAAGRPVIAAGAGGVLETIIDGVTGRFWSGGPDALAEAVLEFDEAAVDPQACVAHAEQFGSESFRRGLANEIEVACAYDSRPVAVRAAAARLHDGWSGARRRVSAPLARVRRGALIVARAAAVGRTDRARLLRRRATSTRPRAVAGLIAWTAGGAVVVLLEPRSLAADARGLDGARGPRAVGGLDAVLDHLGADRRRRLPRRPDRDAVSGSPGRGGACCCGAAAARDSVEPALAAGTLVVIGYGLAGRLLPGCCTIARSVSCRRPPRATADLLERDGRARGARASCWRSRWPATARGPRGCAGAAAAARPWGWASTCRFSRGALFACAAGLIALDRAVRRREQLAAMAGAVLGAESSPPWPAPPFSG